MANSKCKGYAPTETDRAARLLLKKILVVKPFSYLYNIGLLAWLSLNHIIT